MKSKSSIWDRSFKITIVIFLIVIVFIFWLPYLVTTRSWFDLDFSDSGEVGDTIGGITAPFIAVGASILTFIAFWVQFKANEQQREDIHIERFENKFYELIRLHKSNVEEFSIGVNPDTVEKRKSFVSLFNEFRYTFFCCSKVRDDLKNSNVLVNEYSEEQIARLAYIFFYAGIGNNSDIMSKAMNWDNEFELTLFNSVISFLKEIKKASSDTPEFQDEDGNKVQLTIKYAPWGGHQSRLGHYYRHLFQTVVFVISQDNKIIPKNEKLNYLRTLRAQLSDHEQLMLYYNAVAGFGERWILDNRHGNVNYFTDFKMIHNIPIPLANFGIKPTEKFAKELENDPSLFEWLDNS